MAAQKFSFSGKKTAKKDMGGIAMTYGYVYVANVAMGANKNQLLKALVEAPSPPLHQPAGGTASELRRESR